MSKSDKLPNIKNYGNFSMDKKQEQNEPDLASFGLAAPTCANEIRMPSDDEARKGSTSMAKSTAPNEETPVPRSGRSLSIWERIMSGPDKYDKDGKLLPKQRFKKLARMIKMNIAWAKNMGDKPEGESSNAFVVSSDDQTILVFDKDMYKAKTRTYGGISNKARMILAKPPLARTNDDLLILKDVVDRLKCFDKYSRKVKQELARVICYETYDKGRVIIQQGHVGQSFYFIITGSVQVGITDIDKRTGLRKQQIVSSLKEGSSFGELSLIHDTKRTATIICNENNSEFLRVDKYDFGNVLRVSHENEMNDRMRILRWIPTTKDWTEKDLYNLNNHCTLKEYAPSTSIYGNTKKTPDLFTFLVSGECFIVRDILLVRTVHEYGRHTFRLPRKLELDAIKTGRRAAHRGKKQVLERHLWTIGSIGKGHFFGLGEDMTDTYIVTKNRVECLFVPRVQFMRMGHTRMLDAMREDSESTLPTNKQLFKSYFDECDWDKYKQGVIKDIVRATPNRRTGTKPSDVPNAIRMESTRTLGNDMGYTDLRV